MALLQGMRDPVSPTYYLITIQDDAHGKAGRWILMRDMSIAMKQFCAKAKICEPVNVSMIRASL